MLGAWDSQRMLLEPANVISMWQPASKACTRTSGHDGDLVDEVLYAVPNPVVLQS